MEIEGLLAQIKVRFFYSTNWCCFCKSCNSRGERYFPEKGEVK